MITRRRTTTASRPPAWVLSARRKSAAASARCFLAPGHPITGRRSARFRRGRRNRHFVGAPLQARLQFTGRPGSHPSSAALLGVEPGPPCTGVVRLPPARRRASSGWNPHAASSLGGAYFGTWPVRGRPRPPRARTRAGHVGCRLRVISQLGARRRADRSFERSCFEPRDEPADNASCAPGVATPRCRGGCAARIVARAVVVRLGPFHGRRLGERRWWGVLDPGLGGRPWCTRLGHSIYTLTSCEPEPCESFSPSIHWRQPASTPTS